MEEAVRQQRKGYGISLIHGKWGGTQGFVREQNPSRAVLQGYKAQLRATNTSWFASHRSCARHWVGGWGDSAGGGGGKEEKDNTVPITREKTISQYSTTSIKTDRGSGRLTREDET